MFFNSWSSVLRVLLVGTAAYASLIAMLRLSGKRTLSKMNAFDLVVTVALGSTLATTFLSKDVALVDGLVALALLIGLQFIVAWLSSRSRLASQVCKARPTLLFFNGAFLQEALRAERVTEDEVRTAMRAAGLGSADQADAVVLETSGDLSVLFRRDGTAQPLLRSVAGYQGP